MSKNYFEKRRAGAGRCSRSNQSSKTIWPRHRVGVPPHDGTIYLPWGDGKASFVDTRDIAAVAAEALTSSEHEGKTYTLTGPAALGIAEVASILSEATGREINYIDVPESAARDGCFKPDCPIGR